MGIELNGIRNVLLVEDDKVDLMTTQRAMKELGIEDRLHHAANGEEALAFISNPDNPRPQFILLDINMPRMNGIEFLHELRKVEEYKSIPVVVLTTSKEDEDRFNSFDLGVAGYMVKPVDYSQFVKVVDVVFSYWRTSELPS